MTAMASGCGPVVSSSTGKRLESLPREQQLRTLHHRADAGPCIVERVFWFRFRYVFKLEHFIIYALLCNSGIHVKTFYSGHVCVILCVNALVLAPRLDPS
jgi:hypothetical protein